MSYYHIMTASTLTMQGGKIQVRSASSSHSSSPSIVGPSLESEDLASTGRVTVYLPPLLLAALLRNLNAPSSSSAQLSFSSMIPKLSNSWRVREFDDIGALTLRLQLLRHSLKLTSITLKSLFCPLASTELGNMLVSLPISGYSPKVKELC